MHAGLTREFILAIPKTDLHLHLDGSLRLSTLIEMARSGKIELPAYEEDALRQTVFTSHYNNLGEYLRGFSYTCAVLQDLQNIERAAFELAEDNLAEGVRYMEVRFAPQLHMHDAGSANEVVGAVVKGIDRAKAAHNVLPAVRNGEDLSFEYGIIACALRSFSEGMGLYYSKLLSVLPRAPRREVFAMASLELARTAVRLRDEKGMPIVGFDLAGEEAGYPAAYHREAYQFAHSHFLKKTVHAGEAYGPESIFQAITECYANRIGHGTFMFAHDMIHARSIADPARYVEALVEYVASQRIGIEVCPTSNMQTIPSIASVAKHPLKDMIANNLSVSICTDNRLVSNTTVSRELTLVAEHLPLTRRQFRNMVVAGFKGSFYPGGYNLKRAYLRRAITRYDELERRMLDPEE